MELEIERREILRWIKYWDLAIIRMKIIPKAYDKNPG